MKTLGNKKYFNFIFGTSILPPKTSNETLLSLNTQVRSKQFDKFQPERSCHIFLNCLHEKQTLKKSKKCKIVEFFFIKDML